MRPDPGTLLTTLIVKNPETTPTYMILFTLLACCTPHGLQFHHIYSVKSLTSKVNGKILKH